jgi:hypothetical protein
MASEYRLKFSDKVIIASGEDANLRGSWAFLCAGGSMPVLPRTTDTNLLVAVPRMNPWLHDPSGQLWALREPDKQILLYSAGDQPTEVDLSGESGAFRVRAVNLRTGEVAPQFQTLQAGGKASLPGGLSWLTRD